MIGIPFTIRRFGPEGVQDTVIYLRTRRMGEKGRFMRLDIRAYHDAVTAQSKAASRIAALMARTMRAESDAPVIGSSVPDLEQVLNEQERFLDESRSQADMAMAAAQRIALMSLSDNYPSDQVEELVDMLTDNELRAVVGTIELGAMPADFFTSNGIPPSPSTTTPSGGSPRSSSSGPGSAEGTSKPGE